MDGKKLFIQEDVEEESASEEEDEKTAAENVTGTAEGHGAENGEKSESVVTWDYEITLDASKGIGVQLQEFSEFTRIVNIDPNGQAAKGTFLRL